MDYLKLEYFQIKVTELLEENKGASAFLISGIKAKRVVTVAGHQQAKGETSALADSEYALSVAVGKLAELSIQCDVSTFVDMVSFFYQ